MGSEEGGRASKLVIMSGKWTKSWQRTTVKDEINSQKQPLFVLNETCQWILPGEL